jgi:hypothetical protein
MVISFRSPNWDSQLCALHHSHAHHAHTLASCIQRSAHCRMPGRRTCQRASSRSSSVVRIAVIARCRCCGMQTLIPVTACLGGGGRGGEQDQAPFFVLIQERKSGRSSCGKFSPKSAISGACKKTFPKYLYQTPALYKRGIYSQGTGRTTVPRTRKTNSIYMFSRLMSSRLNLARQDLFVLSYSCVCYG